MTVVRRHDLRRLSPEGWREVMSGTWDAQAIECLAMWSRRDFPLVVTRQPHGLQPGRVALGLPAPAVFGRRRLALNVEIAQTQIGDGFPRLADITALLADASHPAWWSLIEACGRLGCDARVYGSHGWQALTGLAYLHPASDIDLLMPVVDRAMADAVCRELQAAVIGLRLDGELVFPGDAAVAWREWTARPRHGLLVKRSHGVGIEASVSS